MKPCSNYISKRLTLLVLAFLICANGLPNSFIENRNGHTSNWAVIVSTSRFWFNYRHSANALGIYRSVQRLGIPDSHIILMLADDMACDPRNSFPGRMFHDISHDTDIYGEEIEVDYRGLDVTAENLIRVLTGRHAPFVPANKRLLTDEGSNILLYLTGHGGDEFLKFQDDHEISAQDIADSIEQMRLQQRYKEILIMTDTCQGATLYNYIYSPGVLGISSSLKGENSYSYVNDRTIGVSLVDRFSFSTLKFLDKIKIYSSETLYDMFRSYDRKFLYSTPIWNTRHYRRDLRQVKVTEFFGYVAPVIVTETSQMGNAFSNGSHMEEREVDATEALSYSEPPYYRSNSKLHKTKFSSYTPLLNPLHIIVGTLIVLCSVVFPALLFG